jgi:hypothetical protein
MTSTEHPQRRQGTQSPDLNPIKLRWSKLKQTLKGFGARTVEDFDAAIAQAMKLITPDDAQA